MRKLITNFVSEYDLLLQQLGHYTSKNKELEIAKHKVVANLRDNAEASLLAPKIWEDF